MCFRLWDYCNEGLVPDVAFHAPCCIIFLVLGGVQVVAGLYYYLSVPVFKLLFNAFIGFTSLVIGTVGLIILCVCLTSVRKYELILYCATAVIFLNAINLVLLEFGQLKDVFSESFRFRIKDSTYDLLSSENGRMVTSVTALISVLVAFVQVQFTFCCLNRVQFLIYEQRFVKADVNPEVSADLEYVIDKKKMATLPRDYSLAVQSSSATGDQNHATIGGTLGRRRKSKGAGNANTLTRQNKQQYLQELENAREAAEAAAAAAAAAKDNTKIEVYTQSWVFKENGHGGQPGSLSSLSLSSPEPSPKVHHPPQPNHQRKISEISQTPSDRQPMPMSSFSRSVTPIPSPMPLSEYDSRTVGHSRTNSDYLAVATTPKHYENTLTLRSPNRLNAISVVHQPTSSHYHQSTIQMPQPTQAMVTSVRATQQQQPQQVVMNQKVTSGQQDELNQCEKKRSTFATSARTDQSYKSLISELEESLSSKLSRRQEQQQQRDKREVKSNSSRSSNSRNSNMEVSMTESVNLESEFSKELEQALQQIMEPNTTTKGTTSGGGSGSGTRSVEVMQMSHESGEFVDPLTGGMQTIV